ncbi:MAG TPA: enoyl-CoA hydratase/isomerase family protein [Streptomyces sp.]|jgi:enoyl-CoA hydratase/carnithine racemase|nr:enoyl-CoA hydratase/isomerase family protein [Streptomyces sp.]
MEPAQETEPQQPGLITEHFDGVARLTIHNPGKRNAMTPDMWREMPELLTQLAQDSSVRTLVLTGSGSTFCAGADITTLQKSPETSQGLAVAAEEALSAFPKPTLAAVWGHCVGGGAQLAAACDLRFASHSALFGITPAKLGIVYPASSTERLVRLVGPATAKYLLFSGELIEAERALRVGLVDEVHHEEVLEARVHRLAQTLATRSQLTQSAAKEFVDGRCDTARIDHWQGLARTSGEAAEGVAAFMERRPAQFTWTP